jgi:tRNA1Val (adenine37-N6)-methyltransferase
MASKYQAFKFRQFTVSHENSAMKVGTDSVLLGCLAVNKQAQHALDIGTGSGLLALMMAQQSDAQIKAVEINQEACIDASFNFKHSSWANRIELFNQPIQTFCENKYLNYFDWILSNPPYFEEEENFEIQTDSRKTARQNTSLSFKDLLAAIAYLLHSNGMAAMVLPCTVAAAIKPQIAEHQLFIRQEIAVHSFSHHAPKRTILVLQKNKIEPIYSQFVIYQENKTYTEAYYQLTKEFYLWLDRT